MLFSSPEPKAHGELIVNQSSCRLSVCLCVSTFSNMNISAIGGPIAAKLYLKQIREGERLHNVLGQIRFEILFPW